MTRLLHPPKLERDRKEAGFDPVVEGIRLGLSRDLSLAIWAKVCADATDSSGRCDTESSQQRFHEVATRIAARGGRLRPDVGRLTRVGAEIDAVYQDAPGADELAPNIPGRDTLVAAEARLRPAPAPERTFATVVRTPETASFDQFRVRGLREMLGVANAYGGAPLANALLGAGYSARAFVPAGAERSRDIAATPISAGHALWRAAERHAATLYRRAVDAGEIVHADPAIEAVLRRCGSGQPLPPDALRTMSAKLGVPLDRVRVHTDDVASAAARALHAEAFTIGEDIFFAAGAFAPGSLAGQRLLAHELTHVVQAWQGRTGYEGRISEPGDPLEREAEAVAERVARNEPGGKPSSSSGDAAGEARRGFDAPSHGDSSAVAPGKVPVRAPAAQPVLRRAAAGTAPGPRGVMPALKGGAKRPTGKRAQQTMQGTGAEFSKRADHAATQATGKSSHQLAEAKRKQPGQRAETHVKAERRLAQTDERTLRGAEKQHLDQAHAHSDHSPDAAAHTAAKPAAPADARSPIKFKAISNWAAYMPAPLPDQDERERKRIEKLVKAKIEGERTQAAQALGGLHAAHAQQARDVRAMKPKLQAQVATAQQHALAHVTASESSQTAAVRGHIASLQGAVRGHAAAMKAQVTAAHSAAIAKISATYQAAEHELTEQRTKAESDVSTSESFALLLLSFDFLAQQAKYAALGSAKAGDALAVGEDQAGGMSGQWDGEKLEAAQKAARDTADGFATSMPEQTAQKWAEVSAQQPEAEKALGDFAIATRTNLGLVFDQSKQALDAAKAQSTQAANAAMTASIAQIDQACASTVASLGAQGASQIAAIREQARSARAGISGAGAAARASVSQACDQAATGIEGGVAGLVRGAQQIEAPDPEQIHQQARKGAQELQQGSSDVAKGLSTSATASSDGLGQQAAGAAEGMASITAALRTSASQAAAAAKQQMSAAANGTKQALGQISASHKTQTDLSVATAQTGFTDQVTALQQNYKTAAETRTKAFGEGYDQFKGDLDQKVPDRGGGSGGAGSGKKEEGGGESGSAPPGEIAAIREAAQKAADAVKPWWQKALAVVVSIVVAVVVVIAVTALIAATGPVGMILVGALAGALSTFAASVASNLVLGNAPLDGITWQSIAIGAIGGAISGGITAGLGAAAKAGVGGAAKAIQGANTATGALKGAAGLRAAAIKNGTEFVSDFVSEQAANLIINHKLDISVENLVLSAVSTVAMGGSKFEGFQETVQAGLQKPMRGGVKVPGLQIQIGVPKPPAAAGAAGGTPGGANDSSHAPAGSHAGAPPANGPPSAPRTRGASPAQSAAPAASAAAPTPAAGHGPPVRPADHTSPSARPPDGQGPSAPPSGGSGPSRPADDPALSQPAKDKPSTRPADPADPSARSAGDAGKPAAPPADGKDPSARPGGDADPAGGHRDPDADAGKPHADRRADGDKPDVTGPDAAKPDGHDKKPDLAHPDPAKPDAHGDKPEAPDPKPHAGADAAAPTARPHVDGGSPEAAAAEAQAARLDGELGELGYAAGTRAQGQKAAGGVEAGEVPPPSALRDTDANARGRRELEQLRADPSLTPEQKAKEQHGVAGVIRAHSEATGNLPRDIADARAGGRADEADTRGAGRDADAAPNATGHDSGPNVGARAPDPRRDHGSTSSTAPPEPQRPAAASSPTPGSAPLPRRRRGATLPQDTEIRQRVDQVHQALGGDPAALSAAVQQLPGAQNLHVVPNSAPGPLKPNEVRAGDVPSLLAMFDAASVTDQGRAAIRTLRERGVSITMVRGDGTFNQGSRINIDPDSRDAPVQLAAKLVHEAHHATSTPDTSVPRDEFVANSLRDEAEATAIEYEHYREAGATHLIADQPAAAAYYGAYDRAADAYRAQHPRARPDEVHAHAQEAGTRALEAIQGDRVPDRPTDSEGNPMPGLPANYREHYGDYHDRYSPVGRDAEAGSQSQRGGEPPRRPQPDDASRDGTPPDHDATPDDEPDSALVSLAEQAYATYSGQLDGALDVLRTAVGDMGTVEGRAKDPVSAANRLKRAIDKFGAEVNDVDGVLFNLWDAVGTRLVVDQPTPERMAEVVSRLTDAIRRGELRVIEANNLHGRDGDPYLTAEQMQEIAAASHEAGRDIRLQQSRVLDGGFTSVCIYVEYPSGVRGEIQLIGPDALKVAAVEHIPYDVGLGKPLVRGIDPRLEPELRAIMEPIEAAIRAVNSDPALKAAYDKYMSDLYAHARRTEVGAASTTPELPPGIRDALSYDGLRRIHDAVEALKAKQRALQTEQADGPRERERDGESDDGSQGGEADPRSTGDAPDSQPPDVTRPAPAPSPSPSPSPSPYDATVRSDTELRRDLKQLPNETHATWRARRDAATEELLQRGASKYRALGAEPRPIDLNREEASTVAHSLERHGPDIPLRRSGAQAGQVTIEGRLYGDPPWPAPQRGSARWFNHTLLHRSVNDYVRARWDEIRTDLALDGAHHARFHADTAVGEGFLDTNAGGPGGPTPEYRVTNYVDIRIDYVPGPPPDFLIVTAFPVVVDT